MNKQHADYVIVGGGTAGLVLGFLLDKYGYDVVVLEAGEDKDEDPNIKNVKSFYGLEDNFHNEYFWLENGKPNPRLPLDGNHYSGGRVLGGSSSINESIYWRGAQKIYDKWGGLFADRDFCLDAFTKLEKFHGKSEAPHLRGTDGPFNVVMTDTYEISEKYISALHAVLKNDYDIHVPIVDDLQIHNCAALSSRLQFFLNPENYERVSASTALIKARKNNLKIILQSTVTKILFQGKKAIGVAFIETGKSKVIYAKEKIILCAGPRSPTLLQHSGIGDKDLLEGLDITVVNHNKEVGQHLTNHLLISIPIEVPPEDNEQIAKALEFKGFGGICAIPDITPNGISDLEFELTTLSREPGKVSLLSILLNPLSRGSVSIASKDPLHPIIVNTNYLSESEDIEKLKRVLEIQEKVIIYLEKNHAGYKSKEDLSNKYEYIKYNTFHIHHWTGTCQIGKVVDEKLNVLGVDNLMIADTSVIPEIVRGHTYAAALLIGAAAFVEITGKRDWQF